VGSGQGARSPIQARTLKAVPPTTSEGVERYLAGGFVKELPVPRKSWPDTSALSVGVIGNSLAVVCSTWPRLPARTYGLTAARNQPSLLDRVPTASQQIPLASLFAHSDQLRSIAIDLGSAAIFWIGSFVVMGACSCVSASSRDCTFGDIALSSGALQMEIARADANGALQQQGNSRMDTALSHRRLWRGVCFRGCPRRQSSFLHVAPGRRGVLSALCFGAAHAYEGVRGIFSSLSSPALHLLALLRRSLRPGMIAHAWSILSPVWRSHPQRAPFSMSPKIGLRFIAKNC